MVNSMLWTLLSGISVTVSPVPEHPKVAEQVTFLYYDDLERAVHFYGDVLGLEKGFELSWVKMYRLSPTSTVGLVNATKGSLRPSADKPVMVSLVVPLDAVDTWYRYLKERGVEIKSPPAIGADGNVKAFAFRDPEGYSLEVFAWLK
jgi:catechol 2,3-dioxygenase-like lactoylglutathione lyase family enzyme